METEPKSVATSPLLENSITFFFEPFPQYNTLFNHLKISTKFHCTWVWVDDVVLVTPTVTYLMFDCSEWRDLVSSIQQMCLCLLIIDQLDKPSVNLVTIDLITSCHLWFYFCLSLFSLLMMLIIDNTYGNRKVTDLEGHFGLTM